MSSGPPNAAVSPAMVAKRPQNAGVGGTPLSASQARRRGRTSAGDASWRSSGPAQMWVSRSSRLPMRTPGWGVARPIATSPRSARSTRGYRSRSRRPASSPCTAAQAALSAPAGSRRKPTVVRASVGSTFCSVWVVSSRAGSSRSAHGARAAPRTRRAPPLTQPPSGTSPNPAATPPASSAPARWARGRAVAASTGRKGAAARRTAAPSVPTRAAASVGRAGEAATQRTPNSVMPATKQTPHTIGEPVASATVESAPHAPTTRISPPSGGGESTRQTVMDSAQRSTRPPAGRPSRSPPGAPTASRSAPPPRVRKAATATASGTSAANRRRCRSRGSSSAASRPPTPQVNATGRTLTKWSGRRR